MDASEDLARILADWHERRDRGEAPDPSDVVAAHPEHEGELRERFKVIELLESRFPRRGPVPQRIGEFHIVREIGRGGMGVVYEAEQPSMRRHVALKVLLPSIVASPRAVKRFQREAQATGALKHTNIVQVHQLGEEGGIWFTALELVDGKPLSEVLDGIRRLRRSRDGVHAPGAESEALTGSTTGSRAYYQRVAAMFADVADALDVAHEHGVVHRDIKPSNLLLDREGNLKIVDFGLARLDDAAAMTMTGDVVGTPNYMSPEQIVGARDTVDGRTDVYSLGATLYEVLALKPPFEAATLPGLVRRIAKEEPRSLRYHDRKVPRDLDTIVLKALEKDSRKRFASAGDMEKELRAFAQGHTIQTRRTTVVEKLWRQARRHKVRTALITTIGVLAIAATVFGLAHERESHRREQLEYERLIEQAQQGMASSSPEAAQEVEALLAEAVTLRPEAPDPYFHRGLLEHRGLEACLADLDGAERRGLTARTVALARAGVLWNASRIPEARAELERAAALPGGGPVDDWLEAIALGRQGQWSAALTRLDRALEETPPASWAHKSALLWREAARGALRDHEGQLEDLSALRQAGLDSVSLRARAAWLWRLLGRDAQARRAFDELRVAVRERADVDAWLELVQATKADWRLEVSAEAVEAEPKAATLWIAQALALIDADRYREAFEAAEHAVELDGGSAGARMVRAYGHLHGRRFWKADRDALEALRLAPDARQIRQSLARLYVLGNRPRDALVMIRKGREADPFDAEWAGLEVEALREAKRHEEALAAVDGAIALQPANARTRLEKAVLLARMQRADEAVALLDDLRTWEGLAPGVVARIASLFADMGRYADAQRILDDVGAAASMEPTAWLVRSMIRRGEGDLDAAIDAARRGLATGSRDASTRSLLVELLLERDGADAAVEVIDGWIADDPREIWPRMRKGSLLREVGKPEEALAVLEDALQLEPANVALLIEYGSCCELLSRFEQAHAASLRALDTDPEDPYLLGNAGGAANNRGQYAEGAAYLERALAIDPHEGRWWSYLAVSYRNLGRPEEAYEAALRGVEESPRSAPCLGHLANIEMRRGRFEEALRLVDAALAIGGDEAVSLAAHEADLGASRATLLMLLHRPAEAVKLATELARRWPKHYRVRDTYASALAGVGRLDEALREHEAALRLAGSSPLRAPGLVSYARTLNALGRHPEALAALEEAMRSGEAESYDALALCGSVLARMGEPERAIEPLDRALAIRPKPYGATHQHILSALVATGQGEAAVTRAREFVLQFPDEVEAVVWQADVLRQMGRAKEAVELLEEARGTSPSNPLLHVVLGRSLAASGQTKRFVETEPERLAALRRWVEEAPFLSARHEELLVNLQVAAKRELDAGNREAAATHAAELDEASKRALERWPQHFRFLSTSTLAAWYRARLAEGAGDWRGVRTHGEEALERSKALAAVDPTATGLSNGRLQIHQACGRAAWSLEDTDALALHTRESVRLARDVLNSRPDRATNQHLLYAYITQAAMLAVEIGRPADAVVLLQEELPLASEQAARYGAHRARALAAAGHLEDAAVILKDLPDGALRGGNAFYVGLAAALHLRDAALVQRILDLNLDYVPQGTDRLLLLAWRFLGADDEATRVLKALGPYVDAPQPLAPAAARAAWFAAVGGRSERARELLEGLGPKDLPHAALFAARAYAALGDEEQALRYLAHAREQGEQFAEHPLDPALAAIASDSE